MRSLNDGHLYLEFKSWKVPSCAAWGLTGFISTKWVKKCYKLFIAVPCSLWLVSYLDLVFFDPTNIDRESESVRWKCFQLIENFSRGRGWTINLLISNQSWSWQLQRLYEIFLPPILKALLLRCDREVCCTIIFHLSSKDKKMNRVCFGVCGILTGPWRAIENRKEFWLNHRSTTVEKSYNSS